MFESFKTYKSSRFSIENQAQIRIKCLDPNIRSNRPKVGLNSSDVNRSRDILGLPRSRDGFYGMQSAFAQNFRGGNRYDAAQVGGNRYDAAQVDRNRYDAA